MDAKLEQITTEDSDIGKVHDSEPVMEKSAKRKRGRGKPRGKDKNHPKPKINEEARKAYDDRVIIKENVNFEKYYRSQSFLTSDEFDQFMEALKQPLPLSFRINTFDMSQANFLKRYVQGPQFNQIVIDQPKPVEEIGDKSKEAPNKIVRLSALASMPWYPKDFAWQMNISRVDLRKIAVLQELHKFIMAETDNGFISRQETVSMIPPLVLDVQWGHNVLDLCAAPGSKTAQLLEYLKHNLMDDKINLENNKKKSISNDLFDDGMVVANDVDNKRCYMLVHQSSRLNSPNCVIINQDASRLPDMMVNEGNRKTKLKFDRVLCDVPCSGDGTARKNVDVWKKWNIQNGNNFHRMQVKILKRGLELLKENGKIVYSTCSLNPVENEAVISSILRASKGTVVLEEIGSKLPGLVYRKGVANWTIMNRDLERIACPSDIPKDFSTQIHAELFPPTEEEAKQHHLDRCIRVLPHIQNTGAFFVACLRKSTAKLPWEVDDVKETSCSEPMSAKAGDEVVQSNNDIDCETNKRNRREPKKRKFKGYKEDPFFFIEPSDPDLMAIKDGFGLAAEFPHNQLVHRCVSGKKRSIYLVSKRTRNFITTNCEESDKDDFVKIINGGMRLFCRASSEAGFRLCQDGVNEVLPYIKDELKVKITKEDLIALLRARTVGFDSLSCVQRVKDDIKLGSFILIFAYHDEETSFEIPLVAWRGEYTVSLYVTNTYKLHLAALVGIKLSEAEHAVEKQRVDDKKQPDDADKLE